MVALTNVTEQWAPAMPAYRFVIMSVVRQFETDGGLIYGSDRLI